MLLAIEIDTEHRMDPYPVPQVSVYANEKADAEESIRHAQRNTKIMDAVTSILTNAPNHEMQMMDMLRLLNSTVDVKSNELDVPKIRDGDIRRLIRDVTCRFCLEEKKVDDTRTHQALVS